MKKINEESSNDLHHLNGHKRGTSELTGNNESLLKGQRNDTGLLLNTITDQQDTKLDKPQIK